MDRWALTLFLSAQAVALAVLLHRFGFPLAYLSPGNIAQRLSAASTLDVRGIDDPVILLSRRVVAPEGVMTAAVYVQGGKILQVLPIGLADLNSSIRVIDYGNAVLAPGIIDPHVHLNEPGREKWEGIKTGTKAAAAGGITTVIDMPLNSNPPTIDKGSTRLKLMLAKGRSYVNFGVWAGLVPKNAGKASVLRGCIRNGARGVKAFLSPSGIPEFPHSSAANLSRALPVLMEEGVPLYVHAELESKAKTNFWGNEGHLASRPPRFERDAIKMVIGVMRDLQKTEYKLGFRVHIAHLSDAESLKIIKEAKASGLPISVETCPHYLKFDSDDVPWDAPEFKCAPPIRDKRNQHRLWDALLNGDIDMLGSDHSPAPANMKKRSNFVWDFKSTWGGISGLQYTLPALWSAAKHRKLTLKRLVEVFSENPAKLANLHRTKGKIKAGYDADIMVWDPDKLADTSKGGCYHRHKLTPYRDLEMKGRVLATWVGGRLAFEDGKGVTRTPYGKAIGMEKWKKV
ncbi:hypothetical protein BSKO_05319 [Bryopsis sp. KO-2023]|nr:hypothetical protein BSKO_05319 [Bryopsis sp. KO-2023]